MNNLDALKNFDVGNISLGDYVILSAATQLGLFDELKDKSLTKADIFSIFPKHKGFIPFLLDALISFGYLEIKPGELVSISPKYKEILLSDKTVVLRNYDWYFLIAQAPSLITNNQIPSLSSSTYNYFIDISESLSKLIKPIIQTDFPDLFSAENKVLDLGCGKMGLFRAISEYNEKLRVVGVDQTEHSVNFVKNYIKENHLDQKVSIIEGSAVDVACKLTEKFDYILLSHLLHWLTVQDSRTVLAHCKRLLKEDGTCIIYEDYISEDGLRPESSVRKSLSLSVLGYQVFNESQIKEMLLESGFKDIKIQVTGDRRVLFYAK